MLKYTDEEITTIIKYTGHLEARTKYPDLIGAWDSRPNGAYGAKRFIKWLKSLSKLELYLYGLLKESS